MRRITSLCLMLIMLCVTVVPTFAQVPQAEEARTVKSVIDVPVGKTIKADFVCEAESATLDTGKKKIAMKDNGLYADDMQDDGICSARVTLHSDKRCTEIFVAKDKNGNSHEYTVNYYNELTQRDFDVQNAVKADIKKIDEISDNAFDKVYEYLMSSDDVCNVEKSDTSITYTTNAGISGIYTHFEENAKGSSSPVCYSVENGEIQTRDVKLTSWTNPNVLCFRPFRHTTDENSAGFDIDQYIEATDMITSITGGTTYMFDDYQAVPYYLLEYLDKVGFFFIDSHGTEATLNGEVISVMVFRNVNNDGITSADWNGGRVFDVNWSNIVAVSTDYIKAHYEEEGRSLKNTYCHLGICMGMKHDNLKKGLIELGASAIDGYTETVSTWYDSHMTVTVVKGMITRKTAEYTCSLTDAINMAKEQHGQEDPAGWGAVMVTYGRPDDYTVIVPTVAPDKIMMAESTEIVTGRISDIPMLAMAGDDYAFNYEQEWKSSDEKIIKVIANHTVIGVADGTATITCTIGGKEYSCEVTAKTVPVESIYLTMKKPAISTGDTTDMIYAVYPRNASDTSIDVRSINMGVAVVSGMNITGYGPGKTTVVAKCGDMYVTSDFSVTSKTVCKSTATYAIDYSFEYAVTTEGAQGNVMMRAIMKQGYVAYSEVVTENGFINATVSGSNLWKLVRADEGEGFYIRSSSTDNYLTMTDDAKIDLTASPETLFVFDGMRLKVSNTDSDTCYIRFKNGQGFSFSKKTSAAKFTMYKKLDFSGDKEHFVTATFKADGAKYEQTVIKGEHASQVIPMDKAGYTFLGWDKSLANIESDTTFDALYREGTTDKVVITYMYEDGTTIATQEYDKGEKVTMPAVDEKMGELTFIGWSESIKTADMNMTVFALYRKVGIAGDANGDGIVNTGDATVVLKFAAYLVEASDFDYESADMTGDGIVNTGDAVAILRYSAAN